MTTTPVLDLDGAAPDTPLPGSGTFIDALVARLHAAYGVDPWVLRSLAVHRDGQAAEHPEVGVPQPRHPGRAADATVLGAEHLARRGHQDRQVVQERLAGLAHDSLSSCARRGGTDRYHASMSTDAGLGSKIGVGPAEVLRDVLANGQLIAVGGFGLCGIPADLSRVVCG